MSAKVAHIRQLIQTTIDGRDEVVAELRLRPGRGGMRKGAGRPRSGIETVTISVRVPAVLADCARARASASGQSLSAWLTELLRFDLEALDRGI